jgi:hypothetical protein
LSRCASGDPFASSVLDAGVSAAMAFWAYTDAGTKIVGHVKKTTMDKNLIWSFLVGGLRKITTIRFIEFPRNVLGALLARRRWCLLQLLK